ncbi:molybdenum cofactor guanylyltransferase [candidate division KSB1 bacterium]|nr:molybdenum cofactor guanylyltransferase [candidate division KSB1 bacterium]
MKLAGVILNGGHSSRMGQPKASLSLPDGMTMLEHSVAPLKAICAPLYIVGGDAPATVSPSDNSIHYPDDRPGHGPAGGLATVARLALADAYLVLTCDQPLLTPSLLSRLRSGPPQLAHLFRSQGSDAFFPFPGYYPQTLLAHLLTGTAPPLRSMREVIAAATVEWIDLGPGELALLRGVNTPAEFAELCQQHGANRAAR